MLLDRQLKTSVVVLILAMVGVGTQKVLHPDHEETLMSEILTVFKLPLEFAEEYSPACVSFNQT